jgi:hypothetical protein
VSADATEMRACLFDLAEARRTLTRIADAMECEPTDDDDLVEAVRLLVVEVREARAHAKMISDMAAGFTEVLGLRKVAK